MYQDDYHNPVALEKVQLGSSFWFVGLEKFSTKVW